MSCIIHVSMYIGTLSGTKAEEVQDTAWEGDVPIVVEPLLAGTSDAEPKSIPVTVEEYPDDGRRKRQAIGNLLPHAIMQEGFV